MTEKYRTVISKQTSFCDIINKVIHTCNNQPQRKIKSTPNEMFDDVSKQIFKYDNDKEFNRNIFRIYIYQQVQKLEYQKVKENQKKEAKNIHQIYIN